jgi:hypothetical protein
MCVSGVLRDDGSLLLENVRILKEFGHSVSVFAVLEQPTKSYRLSKDRPHHRFFGRWRPWIELFVQSEIGFQKQSEVESLCEYFELQDSEADIEKIILERGLLEVVEIIRNSTFVYKNQKLRPYWPYFANTIKMLSHISSSDEKRVQHGESYELVMRIRPDYQLTDKYVRGLDVNSLNFPIYSHRQAFDYGYGYASDNLFSGPPYLVAKLCKVVELLGQLWSKDELFVPISLSAPFLYGDVLIAKYISDNAVAPTNFIADSGCVIRQPVRRIYPFGILFWRFRSEDNLWRKYMREVRRFQRVYLQSVH